MPGGSAIIRDNGLTHALRRIVGSEHVLSDPDTTAGYCTDWTGRFRGRAHAVVRPKSAAEIADVLNACRAAGVGIVPQGGNTGLVGGSTPRDGEVVLSMSRLRDLEPVELSSGTVTVAAGATLADVQNLAARHGLTLPVDLAARDSATVGGMIATNAGGVHAIRHGAMRAHVVGVEAVLANGTVMSRLKGLTKDNTGYNLAGLLSGSEGTLAVITRAVLSLRPAPAHRTTALLSVEELARLPALLARLRASLPDLHVAELILADGIDLVRDHAKLRLPFSTTYAAALLIECAGATNATHRVAEVIEASPEVLDAILADDKRSRLGMWAYRERLPEVISAVGIPVKIDVAVPPRNWVTFIEGVPPLVSAVCPGARTLLFGHAGDGNIHVNVLDALSLAKDVEAAVLQLTLELGGTISGEHGIGTAKVTYLERDRGAADIATMRAIKRVFDPSGLLNPGVLFPATHAVEHRRHPARP